MTNEQIIKAQNDFCGVTSFHERGFKGKGIIVWNTEGNSDHSFGVTQRVLDAAPDCTVIQAALTLNYKAGKIVATATHQGIVYDVEDFITKFKIKILTRSIGGSKSIGSDQSRYWNALKEKYNLIFFSACGNDGNKGSGNSFPADVSEYIAGATLVKGVPKRAWYSGVDPVNDYIAFVGWRDGTSFSGPYMAGICALILSRYGDMSQIEFEQFCDKHLLDMETVGFDNYTGKGMVMLPKKTKIVLHEGSNIMDVDGAQITLDQPAIIDTRTGRLLIPVRAVTQALGAEVKWDNNQRAAIIEL